MDTETVLQIIAMLDTRIDNYNHKSDMEDYEIGEYEIGEKSGLIKFRYHLQEYIELQVSQIEGV